MRNLQNVANNLPNYLLMTKVSLGQVPERVEVPNKPLVPLNESKRGLSFGMFLLKQSRWSPQSVNLSQPRVE
jgi:hypothetical protein